MFASWISKNISFHLHLSFATSVLLPLHLPVFDFHLSYCAMWLKCKTLGGWGCLYAQLLHPSSLHWTLTVWKKHLGSKQGRLNDSKAQHTISSNARQAWRLLGRGHFLIPAHARVLYPSTICCMPCCLNPSSPPISACWFCYLTPSMFAWPLFLLPFYPLLKSCYSVFTFSTS